MLRWIVAGRLRGVFDALNEGRTQPMLDALADTFEYRFEGDSAICGIRRRRESMAAWWARLYRLFPGLRFDVHHVAVSGWPWALRADLQLEFSVQHGDTRYRNVVMQHLRFRGTRVRFIHTLEDTARCDRYLAWRAAQGCEEAVAAPITDAAWPLDGPFLAAAAVAPR